MPIKYIGRTTDFRGKTLWEIVGNLKNFGVGRIVVRSAFERYPEPSYLKICKVETLPNEETRKVRIWAEKTFRGRKYPKLAEVCSTSYKPDYRLLPKNEEESYCKVDSLPPVKVLPTEVPFPPLLKVLIERDLRAKSQGSQAPMMTLRFREGRDNTARAAAKNETPTVDILEGIGRPEAPRLFENVLN